MGNQNQEMVNSSHLNRRGFKGDGLAYLFKPILPQEQCSRTSRINGRIQSDLLSSEYTEKVLPSVKETVGVFIFYITYQVLEIRFCSHDYFNANLLNKWQPVAKQTYNSARAYPLPLPYAVCCIIPPRKYFPKFHERLSHVQ
jgi:hypothetical protein